MYCLSPRATEAHTLCDVVIGTDEDGDEVHLRGSRSLRAGEPEVAGQARIALRAFGDALAHRGEVRQENMFPAGVPCVSLERWREYCDRHSLSGGENPVSRWTTFHKAEWGFQEKGVVRIVDGYAWRIEP